jgi:hypothetical protein
MAAMPTFKSASRSRRHATQEQPERGCTQQGEHQRHRTQEHRGLHVGHVRCQRGAESFADVDDRGMRSEGWKKDALMV